ncbi:hypothetical protein HELRODRAFT_120735, partial [Helobdella robusta]|uniref:Solute carrier family 40 member n=1 Tax=Helobdella robusta TaxID=6412 RepID=T1EGQ5_HELRO
GDWMWQFSVGIYLVNLAGQELRLAAIFGLTGGVSVLLFGGIIGEWVDRNGRLKVVRISLFIQNFSVAMSSVCVCVVLGLEPVVDALKEGAFGKYIMILVIGMAVVAQLSSVAYKIAIEKDWIVVITADNTSLLTNLNAVTRSLDLACKIVSPLTVGLIMSYSSLVVSAVVLAAWNVLSVFLEYAILLRIYNMVPQLAIKGGEYKKWDTTTKTTAATAAAAATTNENETTKEVKEKRCVEKVFEPFVILFSGWKVYARQSVLYAGISLACLYMTVMGFDSITVGYIYANDVNEALVGLCMGLAGFVGIIGAFAFTRMAKRFGLERTGVFAYTAEVVCLILAVASIWAPGTKFDPTRRTFLNHNYSSSVLQGSNVSSSSENNLQSSLTGSSLNTTKEGDGDRVKSLVNFSNISMILLLVGIISSRLGLWMADLVVTQLLQENIDECERGVVNGVQNSLNMLMDMLKFVLVMLLPQIEIFGLHIILSFIFIFVGMLFFYYYAF